MADQAATNVEGQKFIEKMQEEQKLAVKESEALKVKDLRRHIELRSSFCDKLAALSAGSLAVVASLAATLIAKPELRTGALHSNTTWLTWIAIFLWLSLICSVLHNYVAVRIASHEAEMSSRDALAALLVRAGAGSWAQQHFDDWLSLIKDNARTHTDHKARRDLLEYRAQALGGLAIGTFLIAYTLVFCCVLRLWRLA